MKKSIFFSIVTIIILLSFPGCQGILSDDSMNSGSGGKQLTSLDEIYAVLEELGQANLEWMARPGWIHYERIPATDGIMKFSYREHWTHFINDQGECAEELIIIRRAKDAPDDYRLIRMPDGTQGELIALRKGGNIPDYADPTAQRNEMCQARDRSAPLNDLNGLREKENYLVEIKLWEDVLDGVDVIILETVFEGDDENLLAIPSNAKGKLERTYYEKQNGNRIKTIINLLYEDGQWKGETSSEERFEYYEEIPKSAIEEISLSEKELAFYLETLKE